MNGHVFKKEIMDAARKGDDIRLVETIYSYFLSIEKVDFLPWKKLKSFFVAARSKDSSAWKELNKEEADAVDNILDWTEDSANTIAVILRTYERATDELRQAQREGGISRYTAESISRLYKGTLRNLQPRLLEMCLKYGITNEKLKSLVQELRRTVSQEDQEAILVEYMPKLPVMSIELLPTVTQSTETSNDRQTIVLYRKVEVSDLQKLSDTELWELKQDTEDAIQQAIPLLKQGLEQIKQELKKRL